MIKTDGKFYLGGDPEDKNKAPFFYDPDDLTTHAVVVGMTGSGKTGLCIDLLEEAALNDIPALMIDPKGDITNALLHFPELLPEDFKPWINPDTARRDKKTLDEAAEETAGLWRGGLKSWGIEGDRIQALKEAAEFAVYTPGSDAGIPVSILASFEAPAIPWEDNEEILRDKISDTVTAVLGLVGMEDIDPVQSREHILLANIFEGAWSQGIDLDLGELILQTQNPPFEKLGVFDLNTFFPQKDRFELAMTLNNILASPTFQMWIEGTPLDIRQLLYADDGKPRHSVFYIAHLNDAERMFFVTLLYAAVETWMREQKGSTSLRALVYFDEIYGYLPPVANPSSKTLMLRMLKQARAFGVGQVLATQNPVDVDYKALSNAGTWFIGKLQTEQDKERLLDGLEGAVGGAMDRKTYDRLISSLGKRVFLAHNVHEKKPKVFGTRWAMNYLAGPLTRVQIPELNKLVGAEASTGSKKNKSKKTATGAKSGKKSAAAGSSTRAAVPSGIAEYFLPNNLTLAEAYKASGESKPENAKAKGLVYHPVLLAQAEVRYLNRKYDLDLDKIYTSLVPEVDRRGVVRWDEYISQPVDEDSLEGEPGSEAKYAVLEGALADGKLLKSLETDFKDYIYRESQVNVWANDTLKLYAAPPTTKAEFHKLLTEAVQEALEDEVKKVQDKFNTKKKAIEKRLNSEKRELAQDEKELSQRRMEEFGKLAENVFKMVSGSRSSSRISTSLTKRRMTSKAKADMEESEQAIQEFEAELAALAEEIDAAVDEVEEKWAEIASEIDKIPVTPYKKDILVTLFGVAWMPYHQVDTGGKVVELPGFEA